jgi:UDPglucose 6-dehydrogenase
MKESVEDAVRDADAAVLVTEWAAILDADWEAIRDAMATPLLIDGRNALDPDRMRALGFTYEGIGRVIA